jgi:dihydroxyacetone kinase
MTHLYNDPVDFKNDAIEGFSAAFTRYVERVPGASGFVRAGGALAGKVSLVVGGGSGHYPSYGGIVGTGFADGCVLGDVFTSPSTEQIYRVAKAAHGGAGLVLAFGNYAGDRLNFGAARERLTAEGIDTRIVFVTDDVASAPPEEAERRRGIAGTFVVYKVGGAAGDAGESLDDVERLMRKANGATFSFGVAFGGCTFPGQSEPLFTVEPRKMELGLGIHGEPGVRCVEWMPADDLADALVDALLAERPTGAGPRVAVIVNGLGATKYEELFLLYGRVHRRLAAAGLEPVLPEVGEMVTSLDMAGCSLSITWLDEELERYWCAPADTVSFRRGGSNAPDFERVGAVVTTQAHPGVAAVEASEASQAASEVIRRVLEVANDALVADEDRLGRLDAVAGDGDHGVGMTRGMRAAVAAARSTQGGAATVLRAAGDAFGDRAGGTSGMLWGLFLSSIGESLGDHAPVDGRALATAMADGAAAMQRVGKAQPGDKTMLDALLPFVADIDAGLEAGDPLAVAWRHAASVAAGSAEATASLVARIGRARPLAERSIGTPDPGATSMGLILVAVADVFDAC